MDIDRKLRHILVRHEQGAGHAAEGYAAASDKVGVAIATSGPGATNLVTAIADAYMDSVPIVCITGQVFSNLDGHGRLPGGRHRRHHDADHEALLPREARRGHPRRRSRRRTTSPRTGRPGPVLVDITKDAQQAEAPFIWPPKIDLPGYRPVTKAHGKQIAGGGAAARRGEEARCSTSAAASSARRRRPSCSTLAETTGAPVVTTLMARGAFPDSHQQHLGMPGMHGTVPAVLALQEADLLISLGARFDDRVTGKAALFAPNAKVVHVDIDPAEIGKIRAADVPIVGDAEGRARRPDRRVPRGDRGRRRPTLDGVVGVPRRAPRRSSRSATRSRPTGSRRRST